jgi:hypothetical protein
MSNSVLAPPVAGSVSVIQKSLRTQFATPAALCAAQQQWADNRRPPSGLKALFAPKSPANWRYDLHAGGRLAAVAALLDGTPDLPAGTVDNIAALATYPDVSLVMVLFELKLKQYHRPEGDQALLAYSLGYAIPAELAASRQKETTSASRGEEPLGATAASLDEFFAAMPPTAESIELIAAYMQKFRQDRFSAPVAGDLWLKTPVSQLPVRALPGRLNNYTNCYNNNKIVLGGAGAGRSVMMGRLARAAHEKGNQVVMVAMMQHKDALYHYTQKAGGTTREIKTKSQARFNPFWFPERLTGSAKRPPEELLGYLNKLLLSLLETASPLAEKTGKYSKRPILYSYLFGLLHTYYQQCAVDPAITPSFNSFYEFTAQEAAKAWADFNSFCEVATSEAAKAWSKDHYPALEFLTWFSEAGRPFYGTGELAYLMSAQPEEVAELFTVQNRLLYIEVASGRFGDEELRDAVATQCISWLLLFGADVQLGYANDLNRRAGFPYLTTVVDELPNECLTELGTHFMEGYLHFGRYNAREFTCSWHNDPKEVFQPLHKVAHLIREVAGCLLILNRNRFGQTPEKNLYLSSQEAEQYANLQSRQLLITGIREFSGVYDFNISQQELAPFAPSPA